MSFSKKFFRAIGKNRNEIPTETLLNYIDMIANYFINGPVEPFAQVSSEN